MPDRSFPPSSLDISEEKTVQGVVQQDQPPSLDLSGKAYDPTWYTWSRMFDALLGRITNQEGDQYIQARSVAKFDQECKECHSMRDWLLKYSPSVRFMAENISKVGFDLDSSNIIHCTFCDRVDPRSRPAAFFNPKVGIILCQNNIKETNVMEDLLTHEMVHMYDYMRFRFDPLNVRHRACTEIRAVTLSGECRWWREAKQRGNWSPFASQFQNCVRRRAVDSTARHVNADMDIAKKVVNDVWGGCFADTRPFDEIYR